MKKQNKTELAYALGVSRSLLYYTHKQPAKDWLLKCDIEEVLREHPSYGHKRLAIALGVNKKRTLRVMKLFGITPYRKRGKKWKKGSTQRDHVAPNLLLTSMPQYPNHIWVGDFTHVTFQKTILYIATVLDLFTRKIVGVCVLTNHSTPLIINALFTGILHQSVPEIFHSDQGSEYTSNAFHSLLSELNIKQSMSAKGCPWENGYQESFYNQFKVDLGDPNRFENLGALVAGIHKTIHTYNHTRIHSALKVSPVQFTQQYKLSQTFRLSV